MLTLRIVSKGLTRGEEEEVEEAAVSSSGWSEEEEVWTCIDIKLAQRTVAC